MGICFNLLRKAGLSPPFFDIIEKIGYTILKVKSLNQNKAPIVDGIFKYILKNYRSFHVPGHQGGKEMEGLLKLLLKQPLKADLTEVPGLDNLHAPLGMIKDAQEIAAEAFGAEESFFLINGSTTGLMAMINTACRPGEKIILSRSSHQAVFGGIITSGAVPAYISEDSQGKPWEFSNVTVSEVEKALGENPEARALLVNNPTYFGVCPDLKELRKLTSKKGVLLLVDEAHGGHLSFHPELPAGAAEAEADLWVQSTHKTLGSLTQSAMLHLGGRQVNRERLIHTLKIFQSTSPSYLLLASLDAARRQMAQRGKELLDKVIFLAEEARSQLDQLGFELIPLEQGECKLDITRLAFFTGRFKETGKQAADILRRAGKIQVEMCGRDHVLLLLTLGHNEEDLAALVNALRFLRERLTLKGLQKAPVQKPSLPPIPIQAMVPREAVNLPFERIFLGEAAGRISAQMVNIYPPGIPILVPGEVITPEILEYINRVKMELSEMEGSIKGVKEITVIK